MCPLPSPSPPRQTKGPTSSTAPSNERQLPDRCHHLKGVSLFQMRRLNRKTGPCPLLPQPLPMCSSLLIVVITSRVSDPVRLFVGMCACTNTHTHIRTCKHTHTSTHARAHTHTNTHTYTHIHVGVSQLQGVIVASHAGVVQLLSCGSGHTHWRVQVGCGANSHTPAHTRKHTRTLTHTHTHTYIRTQAHTHTHTRKHLHTHVHASTITLSLLHL